MKIPRIYLFVLFFIVPVFVISWIAIPYFPGMTERGSPEEEIKFYDKSGDRLRQAKVALEWILAEPERPEANLSFARIFVLLDANEKKIILSSAPDELKDPFQYFSALSKNSKPQLAIIGWRCAYEIPYNSGNHPFHDFEKFRQAFSGQTVTKGYYEFLGRLALDQYDPMAIEFLEKEITNHGFNEFALEEIIEAGFLFGKTDVSKKYQNMADSAGISVSLTKRLRWSWKHSFPEFLNSVFFSFRNAHVHFGSIGAIVVFFVWLFFLIRIDLFKEIKTKHILLFSLFIFIYPMVLIPYNIIYDSGISDNLSYWVRAVLITGGLEETIKIIPVLLVMIFVKNITAFQLLFFGLFSALLFSFSENLVYFNAYFNTSIISGRALISVTGHLFFSFITVYSLVLIRFRGKSPSIFIPFFLLAMVMHGSFNTALHFMPQIFVVFVVIGSLAISSGINNALNISPDFKNLQPDISKLSMVLISTFSIVIISEFVLTSMQYGSEIGSYNFLNSLKTSGFLIAIIPFALLRIELQENHWFALDIAATRKISNAEKEKGRRILVQILASKNNQFGEPKMLVIEKSFLNKTGVRYYLCKEELFPDKWWIFSFNDDGDTFYDYHVRIIVRGPVTQPDTQNIDPLKQAYCGIAVMNPPEE